MFSVLGSKVVVAPKPQETEKVVGGGIIIKNAKEAYARGQIVDIGPDVTAVKIGQEAVYPAGAGIPITVDGEDLLLLKEDDIHATFG